EEGGELYHAALDLEGSRRAELLAKVDPQLRMEVESLLAQQSGDGILHHSAWDEALLIGVCAADTPLAPGSWVGRFTIESPLGGGGMGNVYKARDSRLGRTVAI